VDNETSQKNGGQRGVQHHVYLQLQADLGVTKHLGGRAATVELLELCHIGPGKYVLDVGCGVGFSSVFLARQYGCRVSGVDALDRMIERARERVKRARVEDKVELRVADAQSLPFEDDLFDIVLCESVLPFVPDQAKAVREFVRVAKAGGFVGLNESTWTHEPPPGERERIADALGGPATIGHPEQWQALLVQAGLHDVTMRLHPVTSRSEVLARVQQVGLRGTLRVFWRGYHLARSKPEYRELLRKTLGERAIVPESYACGLYVGQK